MAIITSHVHNHAHLHFDWAPLTTLFKFHFPCTSLANFSFPSCLIPCANLCLFSQSTFICFTCFCSFILMMGSALASVTHFTWQQFDLDPNEGHQRIDCLKESAINLINIYFNIYIIIKNNDFLQWKTSNHSDHTHHPQSRLSEVNVSQSHHLKHHLRLEQFNCTTSDCSQANCLTTSNTKTVIFKQASSSLLLRCNNSDSWMWSMPVIYTSLQWNMTFNANKWFPEVASASHRESTVTPTSTRRQWKGRQNANDLI